jgi:hypothetical protein
MLVVWLGTVAQEALVASFAAVGANAGAIKNDALPKAFSLGTANPSAAAFGTNGFGIHGRTPEAGPRILA